jgi:hypothetical protein
MADGSIGGGGGGDNLPSKWDLLITACDAGAVLGGTHMPYPGAHYHAADLVEEGLLREDRLIDVLMESAPKNWVPPTIEVARTGAVIWRPTEKGFLFHRYIKPFK